MSNYVASKRLYHTLDRSEVVEEGDPKAAFLLVGEGTELPESEVERLGLRAHFEKVDDDPMLRTKARLAAAVERGALEEAQSHQHALERHGMAQRAGTKPPVVQVAGDVPTAGLPAPKAASRAAEREVPKALERGEAPAKAAAGQEKK